MGILGGKTSSQATLGSIIVTMLISAMYMGGAIYGVSQDALDNMLNIVYTMMTMSGFTGAAGLINGHSKRKAKALAGTGLNIAKTAHDAMPPELQAQLAKYLQGLGIPTPPKQPGE